MAGCAVDGKAGAAEIAGVGSAVVASTEVGSPVVATTDTGVVGYGKLVMGVLSGATSMAKRETKENILTVFRLKYV